MNDAIGLRPPHRARGLLPLNVGLHECFSRVAQRHGSAVAVVCGDCEMTYEELERRSDAWAAALQSAGVRRSEFVPIVLRRSSELVTAVLAVLKCGAAYSLLDPGWPPQRIEEAIADVGARIVVSKDDAQRSATVRTWAPPRSAPAAPAGFRPLAVRESEPACVFFTSGTTGRSKAVVTSHRATARLFTGSSFAAFSNKTVMPLAAAIPWDAFSLELWAVLLNGGTSLVVEEPYLSPAALRHAVKRRAANMVWLTSSLFNLFVDEDLDAFAGLSNVLIGGERLSVGHVRRFLERHDKMVLINGYGPVESTIFATTHVVTPQDCERRTGIPIGMPVPGTQVHVLAESRVCRADEVGEICISGEGLALRYLGDAALTAAKFTEASIDGHVTRIYRTGDLGFRSSDGLLHFCGRADRQIKIRGHRVELAEVELCIERALPTVRSCRVIARTDVAGNAQALLAFCVPRNPNDSLSGATEALRRTLLPHQVPDRLVSVESLPLSPQGKLDEPALLARVAAPSVAAGGVRLESGDATVDLVADVFREVLAAPLTSLDTSFFELGGKSLQAGRVCARLSALLHRPVSLSCLYEHPTVLALAEQLRAGPTPNSPGLRLVTGADVPLTHIQKLFLARHLSSPQDRTGHCLLTWIVEGHLDRTALNGALHAVHHRHEALRAAYVADPRTAARLVETPAPKLLVLPRATDLDAATEALRAELAAPLEITEGELWRAVAVPFETDWRVLFGCVVHHIAFDGWSESVVASDLSAAYNGALDETEGARPPSLAAVYERLATRLASSQLESHKSLMLTELTGAPALIWPDAPGEGAPSGPKLMTSMLNAGVVAAIDSLAAQAGVTRFTVLLSRYAASLADVTGQSDFCIGVPVAQREEMGLERAVGCHINMICVRFRGAALGDGIAAIQETGRLLRRAFAAQNVPITELMDAAGRAQNPGRPRLFQTLFALQDNQAPELALSGLRSQFLRQPYLELPLELHAELWPARSGGLRVDVAFRPEQVRHSVARELAGCFANRLQAAVCGGHS